jgi:DNA-binding transcriptional LysR family regulator
MNITLRQLRAFVAVARTGSFTLAAESLFITQSALSGLIKEIEQTLGVRLFDRSTRRIQL